MKAIVVAIALLASSGAQAASDNFVAGAGKVDITPAVSALRPGDTIRDPLETRAIFLANGSGCAVLVGIDAAGLSEKLVKSAVTRAAQSTGCVADNFIVSATHTHSGSTRGLMEQGEPNEARITDAIVAAAVAAKKAARPARVGYATTSADLNINRDLFIDNRWTQGPNPDGPSDKTVAVLQFVDANDQPIAVYVNYAMHPIHFYLSGSVSADVPGEVSRYIERRFGNDMVAVFAQGASGDQNPNLAQPIYDLIDTRTAAPNANDTRISRPGFWIEAAREKNVNTRLAVASSKPLLPAQLPAYEKALMRTGALVAAKGAILGETVLDAMRFGTARYQPSGKIASLTQELTCPGRDRQDQADPVREGALPPYADGKDVRILQSVLRLGDTYLVAVNGEVYSEIATRLKREATASQVMMTTLANGWTDAGYIYSDNAAHHLTFQVISSRLKPGCAQSAIVGSANAMIKALAD